MSAASSFSLARVAAMVRRYLYLLRSSWPRLLELVYWPAVQLLTWGFLQSFITQSASAGGASWAAPPTTRISRRATGSAAG